MWGWPAPKYFKFCDCGRDGEEDAIERCHTVLTQGQKDTTWGRCWESRAQRAPREAQGPAPVLGCGVELHEPRFISSLCLLFPLFTYLFTY